MNTVVVVVAGAGVVVVVVVVVVCSLSMPVVRVTVAFVVAFVRVHACPSTFGQVAEQRKHC